MGEKAKFFISQYCLRIIFSYFFRNFRHSLKLGFVSVSIILIYSCLLSLQTSDGDREDTSGDSSIRNSLSEQLLLQNNNPNILTSLHTLNANSAKHNVGWEKNIIISISTCFQLSCILLSTNIVITNTIK